MYLDRNITTRYTNDYPVWQVRTWRALLMLVLSYCHFCSAHRARQMVLIELIRIVTLASWHAQSPRRAPLVPPAMWY